MRALILVDLQNDFMPDGALPVPEADEVVAIANSLADKFDLVVATQDWHPADHASFASNQPGRAPGEVIDLDGLPQVLWPDHCVQGTEGAEFVDGLDTSAVDAVFRKGMDRQLDSYSGFFDNGHHNATGLAEFLRQHKVGTVFIAGVATDYCVRWTALDAVREGFRTFVVVDACRGVRVDDAEQALAELRDAGVRTVTSNEVAS